METTKYFKKRVKPALAEAVGVHITTMIRWVKGDSIPDAKTALKLEDEAAKLGLDIPAECWLLRERFPHPGLKSKEA